MNKEKNFLDAKENALKSLEKAHRREQVDEQILPVLTLINNLKEYYTSSSCAGRIVLLEIPSIGDKRRAQFLGKWHENVKSDRVLSCLNKAKKGMLWLLAQPPILHIGTDSIENADRLIKIGVASGFKNSGIRSVKKKKIIIEICSTERVDAPIGKDGKIFCDLTHLQLLVDVANEVIKKSIVKLNKFEKNILESFKYSQINH